MSERWTLNGTPATADVNIARIVNLEHESGLRPLGDHPDHCVRCRQVAGARARQATCQHESVNEVLTLSGLVVARNCADCGAECPTE